MSLRRDALKLIWDIRQAGEAVAEFLKGKSLEDYQSDLMLRSAVDRQLLVVGEALSQLRRLDEELSLRTDNSQLIIGFRNRLAHGYADIVDKRVYETAKRDLPKLVDQLLTLIVE